MKRVRTVLVWMAVLSVFGCRATRHSGVSAPEGTLFSAWQAGYTAADLGYTDSDEATFLYTEGVKALSIYEDTATAKGLFIDALTVDSTHGPSHYQLAMIYAQYDAFSALSSIEKALLYDAANSWYRMLYGRLLLANQRWDESLELYKQLVGEDASNPDNYRILAILYAQRDLPLTAITILDSAERTAGRFDELVQYKRQLLFATGQFDKALEEAQAQAEEQPLNAGNRLAMGEIYAAMGRDSLALAAFDRALELSPDDAEVLIRLYEFYKERGDDRNMLATIRRLYMNEDISISSKAGVFEDLTRSREYYQRWFLEINGLIQTLVAAHPGDERVLSLYINHLLTSGSIDDALALMKGRLEEGAPSSERYTAIIEIESYLERYDSVGKYSDEAVRHFPRDVQLRLQLGYQLFDTDPKASKRSLGAAVKYAENDSIKSVVYGVLGDLYVRQGRHKKGYAQYDRSLSKYPDNALVLNNYAYFLCENGGDLNKALAMSERSNLLRQGDATHLDTQAWILYRLGRLEEAKKIMLQAIALDRRNSDVLYLHYGDILNASGDRFMAEFYWRKALEAGYDSAEIQRRLDDR